MNNKVAVCISGEMRFFKDPAVVESYSRFVQTINPDVFISTWDHIGISMNHGYINPEENKTIENNIEDHIRFIYPNIKSVKIENYNSWFNSIDNKIKQKVYSGQYNKLTVNSYAQIYKICDSINLKSTYEIDNNFKYDIVIRLRPDSLFINPFNLDIKPKTIYNINFGSAYYPNRIYDILFYGDSMSMDKVSDSFLNYTDLLDHPFNNGLCPRDSCRILHLQSILSELEVLSTDSRLCDVYRGQGLEEYSNLIKSWGEHRI